MKTPKRVYVSLGGDTDDVITARKAKKCARWKRKNKLAQYKRTIARLSDESRKYHDLWIGKHLKMFSPEWEAFILLRKLQTPAEDAPTDAKRLYWLDLRNIGGLLLNAACLAAREAGRAEEKEAYCLAQADENAKQGNLLCSDEEQLTERKGN